MKNKMSSYEDLAEKILRSKGISYNKQVPEIPWKRYKTDFVVWICFIKFLIEIDWEHHTMIKQRLSDRKKDIYSRLYWYRVVRVRTSWNFKKKIENMIIRLYFYAFFIWILRIATTTLFLIWIYKYIIITLFSLDFR